MLFNEPLTLTKLAGKYVTFTLESGEEIQLLKEDFPKNLQIGQVYMLTIQPAHEAQLSQQELARTLLNEILADDSQARRNPTS